MKKTYYSPSVIYVKRVCESSLMGGSIPIKDGEGDFDTKHQDFRDFSTWDDSDSDSDF